MHLLLIYNSIILLVLNLITILEENKNKLTLYHFIYRLQDSPLEEFMVLQIRVEVDQEVEEQEQDALPKLYLCWHPHWWCQQPWLWQGPASSQPQYSLNLLKQPLYQPLSSKPKSRHLLQLLSYRRQQLWVLNFFNLLN